MLIECRNLNKNFGSKTALKDVSLNVESGKIIGLLGPNGSGKTTLIKILSGILTPSSGDALISGKPIGIETKKIVSYLPERTYLNEWMSVRQAVSFFSDFYSDFSSETAYDMLERLNINPAERLKTMSKGTREKVQLILVMSRKAELYLLDEPIGGAGLYPENHSRQLQRERLRGDIHAPYKRYRARFGRRYFYQIRLRNASFKC